jgi:hypothetical protein
MVYISFSSHFDRPIETTPPWRLSCSNVHVGSCHQVSKLLDPRVPPFQVTMDTAASTAFVSATRVLACLLVVATVALALGVATESGAWPFAVCFYLPTHLSVQVCVTGIWGAWASIRHSMFVLVGRLVFSHTPICRVTQGEGDCQGYHARRQSTAKRFTTPTG